MTIVIMLKIEKMLVEVYLFLGNIKDLQWMKKY